MSYEIVIWIKDIITIIAGGCAITAFVLWKRNVVLSIKLSHFEDFYLIFIELYECLDLMYAPKLYSMSVGGINVSNDVELNHRIHKFRHQQIIKNLTLYYKLRAKQPIIKIYFKDTDAIINDFCYLWMNLIFVTENNYENCPDHIKHLLCLDPDLLKIYREHTSYKASYSNEVLDKLNKWKEKIEKQFATLT